jgi:hypothetical protein
MYSKQTRVPTFENFRSSSQKSVLQKLGIADLETNMVGYYLIWYIKKSQVHRDFIWWISRLYNGDYTTL